jgi:hypothetical protein
LRAYWETVTIETDGICAYGPTTYGIFFLIESYFKIMVQFYSLKETGQTLFLQIRLKQHEIH